MHFRRYRDIWQGLIDNVTEKSALVGCDVKLVNNRLPTFRRKIVPHIQGSICWEFYTCKAAGTIFFLNSANKLPDAKTLADETITLLLTVENRFTP